MPTAKKDETIGKLRGRIEGAHNLFFTDFRGLTVGELRTLRNALRKEASSFSVVKNALFGKAIDEARRSKIAKVLEGPTGVAFAGPDPVGTAKALTNFANESKKLRIKAALIDGELFDAAKIGALAKVPPRQELLATLVGSLKSPLHRIVGVLHGNKRKLVHVLQAIHQQKSASESPAA